jgi:putative flippase GtrA
MTDIFRIPFPGRQRTGELGRFAIIGVASTLAYLAICRLLRTAAPADVANLLALALTTVGNTTANRRLTFGVRERRGLGRDHVGGFAAFGVALVNGLATIVRFVLLRTWIVRGHDPAHSVISVGRISS